VGRVTRWLRCEKCVLRRKHRTEVTEATEGESEGRSGLGDTVAFSARSARFGESIAQRSRRSQRGIGEGKWVG
jgi:hypothetical protein